MHGPLEDTHVNMLHVCGSYTYKPSNHILLYVFRFATRTKLFSGSCGAEGWGIVDPDTQKSEHSNLYENRFRNPPP